jgi:hypothetical protein
MPQDDDDGDAMMWMDEEAAAEEPETAVSDDKDSERVAKLEAELARTRTELSDVRRELAAKVMNAHAWQVDQTISWGSMSDSHAGPTDRPAHQERASGVAREGPGDRCLR